MKLFNFDKKQKTGVFYLLLFGLCFFPMFFYLNNLGFYWDDWSQLFLHMKFGDQAFWEYFSYNRPLSAWTDILFFKIGGSSPLIWHLLIIFLKFCLCVLFYKTGRILLPEKKSLVKFSSALFAICPLFSQLYISIAYTQHFTDYILFLLSVLFLLRCISSESKVRKIVFYFVSVIFTILHLTISEYIVFLELLKIPVLLIFFKTINISNTKNKQFLLCMKYDSIHLIIFAVYCFYRLNISRFFNNFAAETPDLIYLFLQSPMSGIYSFAKNLVIDLAYPFTGFISKLFDFKIQSFFTKSEMLMLIISFVTAFFSASYFGKNNFSASNKFRITYVLFCFTGIFLSVLPFIIMNENFLNTDDPYHADRTFFTAVPFVCFVFSWILCEMFPVHSRFAAAAGVIVFLFCHYQMTEYQTAKQFSDAQNHIYRQMAERIPGIEDGTAIVDDSIIFPQQGNFSTASALNILYPNEIRESGDVPLWVFSYDSRLYEDHGLFHVQNRNYFFKQPPSDYIYIDYDNKFSNCVWVFNPNDTDNPHVTDLQRSWIRNSNFGRIKTTVDLVPDKLIFGNQEYNWCYYYQNAELLRQKEDWEALAGIAYTVLEEGFSPNDNRSNSPYEWWPFIEGLLREGNIEKAKELADSAIHVDEAYKEFFAVRFERLIGNQ